MRVRTNFGLLLRNKGLSRHQFAKDSGLPYCIIQQIAAGLRVPTDQQLLEICTVLGCTEDLLYPDDRLRELLKETTNA